MLSIAALAAQDEAYGVVTNVLDGDTFDVAIEKVDPRITSSVERIRLADVNSPEIDAEGGLAARDFTYAVLMNKRVFLDIDDASGNGRDPYGRLVCVAYLTGAYGWPLSAPSFNRMLVDSGHAEIDDFTNNEFSLKEARSDKWRSQGAVPEAVPESVPEVIPGASPEAALEVAPEAEPKAAIPEAAPEIVPEVITDFNLSNQLEDLKNNLISQLRDDLAKEFDRWANETVDWLRG